MCICERWLHCPNKFLIWVLSWKRFRIYVSMQPRLEWIWGHLGVKSLVCALLVACWWLCFVLSGFQQTYGERYGLDLLLRPISGSEIKPSQGRDCSAVKDHDCALISVYVCVCVWCERKQSSMYLSAKVSPSVRLNSAPMGHGLGSLGVCVCCMWNNWHVLLHSSVGVNMYDQCNGNIRGEAESVSV